MSGSSKHGAGPAASRRPTLKTIAELCGLGVPTVSRALNDSPEIGAETKRRIRQIAEEIGYVPDRAGLRLRTGRTQVISLVFVMNRDEQLGRLIPALATALLSTPFQIGIVPALTHEDALASIRKLVEQRMADAVVFNETLFEDPRVSYLLEQGRPFATHGRNTLAHLHPHYDFDNAAFARQAAQILHGRGRRSLALFGAPQVSNYGRETLEGAAKAAADLGLAFQRVEGHSNDPLAEIQSAAALFVAQHPDCDGYVCSSGMAAMAIVSALSQAGRVIGQDVDVIAKGSRVFLQMIHPAIVAIEEDVTRAASFLARAVVQAVNDPAQPPMQEIEVPDFPALG